MQIFDLSKFRVVVTSGPTREYIDPVRFISNPSSGKMGYHIAQAALEKNWQEVVYICGAALEQYKQVDGANNIQVDTTQQMLDAVLKHTHDKTILIMAAAPADYKTAETGRYKLKKNQHPLLQLEPTQDILLSAHEYVQQKKIENFYAVGFAAETDHIREHGLKKLREKNLEMIFINDVTLPDSGFSVGTNRLTMLRKDGTQEQWEKNSKQYLGQKIMQEIQQWLESPSPSTTKPTN